MKEWEYRTIRMDLETWEKMHEKHEDFVVTYADGTRVEGIEALLRLYLDEGEWELVSIVPTGFRRQQTYHRFDADTLMIIFRRQRLQP